MSSSEKDWIKKLIPQEQSSDLDEKDIENNKHFWWTVKPLVSNKVKTS